MTELERAVVKAAILLACEAGETCEDGTLPRLYACVEEFWQAYARYNPDYRPRPSYLEVTDE
jgi:hypothetical protein